ncbi:hypothetical protein [Streptacidiphilus anmyonensis]|uniref:hypothetical protein n=1 Tax=Streptacidiphilus anmyonensis TaxID=405782 RepID=UPI0005AB0981|nr:hypothetical protein [Streptacidiphilus anmyonensis]
MSTTAPGGSAVIRLRRLTMVPEDDGVMVGRPDIASYALFPQAGAELLRMLDAGTPLPEAVAWYEQACGEELDVPDFLDALDGLGFLLAEDEEEPEPVPVRWQRLGRWVFSWPAWIVYAALTVAGVAAMVVHPELRPSYRNVFFTDYLALIPVGLLGTAIAGILLHEAAHALAGRRLGLPSRLGISRRLYYVVAETRLDALLSVPRRRRYLPFLAGMVTDTVLCASLTLLAWGLDRPGIPAWCHRLCLAVAFSCVLRLIWQFMFYLQTDLYFVVATLMRCQDLQAATKFLLRTRIRRALRRPVPQLADDEAEWSDRDRAMARWYAPVLVAGYGFSLGSLAWAGIPTMWRFWSTAVRRFTTAGTPVGSRIDAALFAAMAAFEIGVLIHVTLRDRRARARTPRPEGATA